MEIEANRESGMTQEEARLSATKSFRNVSSVRDLAYEVRGGGFMETLWQDFVDWRAPSTLFESVSAVRSNESYNFTGAGEPERLQGRLVSAGFLSSGVSR